MQFTSPCPEHRCSVGADPALPRAPTAEKQSSDNVIYLALARKLLMMLLLLMILPLMLVPARLLKVLLLLLLMLLRSATDVKIWSPFRTC